MRMDRMSPRSSVTGGSLQSRQECASERRLREVGRIGKPAEAGGSLGCLGRRGGTGALADPGESCPQLVGDRRVELREGVADDPGAVAVVVARGTPGLGTQLGD